MSMPHQDFPENYLNFDKHQRYAQEKNEISFWAFLFSLFIYISIFYIFSLSPSFVLKTTKFWFFISITLILIIAADYGAFSQPMREKDCYYEYTNISRKDDHVKIESHYQESGYTTIPATKMDTTTEILEEIKEVVIDDCQGNLYNSQCFINYGPKYYRKERQVQNDAATCGEKRNKAKIAHSMSHSSNPVANKGKNTALRKTEFEKYDIRVKNKIEESDYSSMSNEELNRRVEEFIQKFNRQIRLQAVQNRIQQF